MKLHEKHPFRPSDDPRLLNYRLSKAEMDLYALRKRMQRIERRLALANGYRTTDDQLALTNSYQITDDQATEGHSR